MQVCAHRFDDWSDEISECVQVLNPDLRERLWPYMGGIAKQNGMIPKRIGTFQEEYLAFLKKHGTHFDEKYFWD